MDGQHPSTGEATQSACVPGETWASGVSEAAVVLRDAAGEVDAGQVLRGGDGVPEHRPVRRHELDDVGRQAAVPEHVVHGVAGRHGRVAGLPQNHVTLETTRDANTRRVC